MAAPVSGELRRAAARWLLTAEAFSTLLEAPAPVEDQRIEYKTVRPHSTLDYLTPTDYARTWTTNHPVLSKRM